jgi:putative ABC transport system ATP-binding protein
MSLKNKKSEKVIENKKTDSKEILATLKDITKEYDSGSVKVKALNGVDLTIYKGVMHVILGQSGCGKTTLLNIIGGLDSATSGTFVFEGEDQSELNEKGMTAYRRDKVGFIFQSYNLMPELTVKENVDFIAGICKEPLNTKDMLKSVGIDDLSKKYPSQLSGGQAQRVAIARALVKNPKIILADEPTAALDYATSVEVLGVIREIVKKGATLVMVTHNEEIAKMADCVIRMKDGKIVSVTDNESPCSADELHW